MLNDEVDIKVSKIILNDGSEIDFSNDKLGYAQLSNNNVIRILRNGKKEVYPLKTIDKIYKEEFDTPKTILLLGGLGLGAVIVLGITMSIIFSSGT